MKQTDALKTHGWTWLQIEDLLHIKVREIYKLDYEIIILPEDNILLFTLIEKRKKKTKNTLFIFRCFISDVF